MIRSLQNVEESAAAEAAALRLKPSGCLFNLVHAGRLRLENIPCDVRPRYIFIDLLQLN
jgi:hypothetical protein